MTRDWQAVAEAINTRMEELDLSQQELATRSGVSVATLRELQHNKNPRRRSARLLAAISEGLRWPSDYLAKLAEGEDANEPTAGPALDALREVREELAELRQRVAALEKDH
ncbi:Helix-turn-helix domain-containing protein [Actinopolyspora xinjiangensis]|uniref:Helix-turn-helix domain-containing protein n=1 Tax=Actinopolyspora xinjiangensis TaxID=405564 RepID=A0A1H0WBG9_9ACTN|nr:helix-turn-helix domain-containing protein [Actinopolyspora xinjiangensis]SDP88044.1 Helix-turn-helix domain-containing protein [Actinopolyspora xinjiangensis]